MVSAREYWQRRDLFSGPGVREWYLGERCWHQTSYEAFIVPRRPPRKHGDGAGNSTPGHLLAAQDESLGDLEKDSLDRKTQSTPRGSSAIPMVASFLPPSMQ